MIRSARCELGQHCACKLLLGQRCACHLLHLLLPHSPQVLPFLPLHFARKRGPSAHADCPAAHPHPPPPQAVLETCLAMTIFRTDFTVSVVSMFVVLSFVKIFHWLVRLLFGWPSFRGRMC